jgi:hypothetical protein
VTESPRLQVVDGHGDQMPPWSEQAEQAVIGAVLQSDRALAEVAETLAAGEFYKPSHELIYAAAQHLASEGKPVDAVTVADELDRRGDLHRVGGRAYLHTCITVCPAPVSAGHYAEIVHEKAQDRRLLAAAQRLVQLASAPPGEHRLQAVHDEFAAVSAALNPSTSGPGEPRRSWRPVDLTAVLDGTYQPVAPTVGARSDGVGLFYPGRLHTIASESEGGKTWFALLTCAHELEQGNAVVYLDFEDDEGGVVGRLLALGAHPNDIRARFASIRPDDALTALGNRDDLGECLGDLRPTLAVLDGVTEAMALHGLELKDNTGVAVFGKMLPRWIADQGPATVALDHVVKDRENRGRYAIGGQHKLAGLNGAAYTLENRTPMAIGQTGKSSVYIAKDRPAQLRRHALPSEGKLHWFGDLVVASDSDTHVAGNLYAPTPRETAAFRPDAVMAKITSALVHSPVGLSKNAIETTVGGRRDIVRLALEILVNEGAVLQTKQGAAMLHTLNPNHGADTDDD